MTPEVVDRLRRAVHARRMVGIPAPWTAGDGRPPMSDRPTTMLVDMDDLQALLDAYDARPALLITVNSDLTETDFEKLRRAWNLLSGDERLILNTIAKHHGPSGLTSETT